MGAWSALAAVVWFYGWTVKTTCGGWPAIEGRQLDYYNLLVDGFRSGNLFMDVEPEPELVAAENPYDPAQRPAHVGLHDAAYFQGKYYLYWGAAPVVTLFLPFRLVTGHHLPLAYGNLWFATIGFLALSACWREIRRRYFQGSAWWMEGAGILVLGLATFVLAVLRRPSIWELPIASGFAFAMLAVWAAWHGVQQKRAWGWWVMTGLALGLAVGSRPTYLFAVPLLAGVWLMRWPREDGRWVRPNGRWWGEGMVLGASFGAVIAAILAYNFLRFGNPLEFGLNYQLTSGIESQREHFSLRFIWYNFQVYFLEPAWRSRYFPFVQMIRSPVQPEGYYGIEFVYGMLPSVPVVGGLAGLGWLVTRRGRKGRALLSGFVGTLGLVAAAMTLTLLMFVGAAARYMVDFVPLIMLTALIGVLVAEAWAAGWRKRAVRGLFGVTAAASVFFGLGASWKLHDLLEINAPNSFAEWSRWWNWPVHRLERWLGSPTGPLDLEVVFPAVPPGTYEPLVTTGWEYASNCLWVFYASENRVKFGLLHARGVVESDLIDMMPGQRHRLLIEMGPLYPPPSDARIQRMTRSEVRTLKSLVRVSLDDEVVFSRLVRFHDSSPGAIRLGENPMSEVFGRRFSGEIEVRGRGGLELRNQPLRAPTWFSLRFAPEATGVAQPLIVTGETGRADALYVRQLQGNRLVFGYESWGRGVWESDPARYEPGQANSVAVQMPSLLADPARAGPAGSWWRNRVVVKLNERVVWMRGVPSHPHSSGEVTWGQNHIESTVLAAQFYGATLATRELPVLPAPSPATGSVQLEVKFPADRPLKIEPLLSLGRPGRVNVLGVRYEAPGQVRFVFYSGVGAIMEGELIDVPSGEWVSLELKVSTLERDIREQIRGQDFNGGVGIWLNGQLALQNPTRLWWAELDEIEVLANPAGAEGVEPWFTGDVRAIRRPEAQ